MSTFGIREDQGSSEGAEAGITNWLEGFRTSSTAVSNFTQRKNRLVCITGGKGGVGKTSVTLKLALELGNLGHKVLVIDCDTNLSNTRIKLGIPLREDFFDLLSGTKKFEDCIYKRGNFHLLSACNGNLDLFDGEENLSNFIIDIAKEHKQEYDFIFLDSPAGVNDYTMTLAAFCDDRLFVVNPDTSSITDSYALMKILKNRYGIKENLLIVNKSQSKSQYNKVVKTLSETAENFLSVRTVVLGDLPYLGKTLNFDNEFIYGQNSPAHPGALNILKKYVDRVDDFSLLNPSQQAQPLNFGQEVQSI